MSMNHSIISRTSDAIAVTPIMRLTVDDQSSSILKIKREQTKRYLPRPD